MSMSDRELMLYAGKAVGCDVFFDINGKQAVSFSNSGYRIGKPLEDDGDALRLAYRLGMKLCCDDAESIEILRKDIVRAAAEIGKSMQESK